jgi:hypothetical protein
MFQFFGRFGSETFLNVYLKILFFYLIFPHKCEHLTPVRDKIFQQEPYLDPKRGYSIADRDGTVANFRRKNNLIDDDEEYNRKSRKSTSVGGPSAGQRSGGAKVASTQRGQRSINPNSKNNNQNEDKKGCSCTVL